jgi:TPR repeat protein
MTAVAMKGREEIRLVPKSASGDALFNLGVAYSTGQGAPLDLIEAHKWFNLAALKGSQLAREWRTNLAAEMSPDEIAEAQRQARAWLATA